MLTSIPLLPPVIICKTQELAVSEWLCEDKHWPVIHTIYPLLVYLYLRDAKMTFLLAYIFESLEAVATVIIHTYFVEEPIEEIGDSLLSDIIMAMYGISIAYMWTVIYEYRYRMLAPMWEGIEWKWIFYIVQLLCLAAPTLVLFALPGYIDGLVAISYIAIIVWIPGVYYFFAWVNRNHMLWKKEKAITDSKEVHISFMPVPRLKKRLYWGFHGWTSLFMFIYLASFIYRYTHVFLMAVLHNTFIVIVLFIYYFSVVGEEIFSKK